MHAAEPRLVGALDPLVHERRTPLVERHRVEAMLDVGRQRQAMKRVQRREDEPEIGDAERGDGVEQADEADRRLLDDDASVLLDAVAIHLVDEIERDGRPAAEADDVDDAIAADVRLAERLVGLVDPIEPSDAPRAADDLAWQAEARAD